MKGVFVGSNTTLIEFLAAQHGLRAAQLALRHVCLTFMLGLLDSFILNKEPLPLVPLASPTPLQDDRGECQCRFEMTLLSPV